jgi:hypothetical protein
VSERETPDFRWRWARAARRQDRRFVKLGELGLAHGKLLSMFLVTVSGFCLSHLFLAAIFEGCAISNPAFINMRRIIVVAGRRHRRSRWNCVFKVLADIIN